jgi:dienelactone hydrolase
MSRSGSRVAGTLLALALCLPVPCSLSCSLSRTTHPLRPALPVPEHVASRFAVPPTRELSFGPPADRGGLHVRQGVLEVGGREVGFSLYLPAAADGPLPLIVCIPILAAGRPILVRISSDLARRGFATAFLEREGGIFRRQETAAELEEKLRTHVVEHRGFIEWCTGRPELDPDRIGILGLSLGGILGAVLTAVEPRIRAASICLAGGDLPGLLMDTTEGRIVDWVEEQEAKGLTRPRVEDAVRAALTSDPARLGAHVDPRRVFLVTASLDEVMPRRNATLLWESLGRPKRLVIPLGHYTTALAFDLILSDVESFSRERFAE